MKLSSTFSENPTYLVLDLLGEGGFGKVYRARMEGTDGFVKEVALKILNDEDPPLDVLQRFRDESRILGLVRDRAIVKAEPPIRLSGRWAVVMEYVDGATTANLVKNRPMPPRAVIGVVQEVARALHHAYHQQGPDGPLELIHRDIKPANIQVTLGGAVKLLDFGVAKASFEGRESHTTHHLSGTRGYIAPERLEGDEGPAGDVYSLGVTLGALLFGKRPKPDGHDILTKALADDPARLRVWELGLAMMSMDPRERPTARQVEDLCLRISEELPGLRLDRWAERHHAGLVKEPANDELVGRLLSETTHSIPTATSRAPLVVGGVFAMSTVGIVATLAVLVCGAGFLFQYYGGEKPVAVTTDLLKKEDIPSKRPKPDKPVVVNPPQPADPPGTVEPPVVEPAAKPKDSPKPVAPVVTERKPKPVRPKPKPAKAALPAAVDEDEEKKEVRMLKISFGSIPVGATVLLDGKTIGKTPKMGYPVPEGAHTVKMIGPNGSNSRKIRVGDGNTNYVWKGGGDWVLR